MKKELNTLGMFARDLPDEQSAKALEIIDAVEAELDRLRGYESAAGILAVEKAQLRRENERLGADFNAARDSLDRQIAHTQTIADEQYRLRAALAEAQRDAERYRFLQRRVCVVGTEALCGVRMKAAKFDFVNLPKLSEVPGNAARALDAAIDAAILATKEGRSNG